MSDDGNVLLGMVTRPPSPDVDRELARARQRERLMAALIRCCAVRGFAATTVAHVVAEAHVSRSAFYAHFHDREDCFLQTYEAALVALFSATGSAVPRAETARERIGTWLRTYLTTLARNPEAARFALVEVNVAGPAALARRLDGFTRFAAVVRYLTGDELVATDFEVEAVVAAVSSIVSGATATGRLSTLPELTEPILGFALHVLTGPRAQPAP